MKLARLLSSVPIAALALAACNSSDQPILGPPRMLYGGADSGTASIPGDSGSSDAEAPGPGGTAGMSCEVDALLGTYCRSCHSAPPIAGAPMALVTYADLMRPSVSDPAKKVAEMCLSRMRDARRPMPPSGLNRPSESEIAAFDRWIQSGYLRGTCARDDAGSPAADAGSALDGARPPPYDAGASPDADAVPDAGAPPLPDAEPPPPPPDSGEPPDSGIAPPPPDSGVAPDSGVPPTMLCRSCNANSDCNPTGTGNFCVQDPSGGAACGTVCNSASDCPSGFDCYQITDSNNQALGNNCFPSNNGSCFSTPLPDAGTPVPDSGATFPDAGEPPPPDAGTAAPDASPPDSGSSCTDTWSSYAQGFFNNNCARCHGGQFTQSSVAGDAARIQNAIDTGAMPKDTTLSSAEIARIDRWFACGMP